MKRVLAVLLCILCAMLLLVACGDETDTDTNASTDTNTDTNQGTNNTDNQGHTHTFKTNEDWSKDAQGHWYDATCDCEDVTITKLNHTDANNDGACDVCTYTNHEHEYSEEWTADCTNHWNAADCGHTVAGINVAAHEDENKDGRCDVCNYIIKDIHEHYYSTEWTSDGEYHWHAALCEHKVELKDKEAHNVNAAGFCTVCDAKVKEIDKTDIKAVLEAAIANNYKVVSGKVIYRNDIYDVNENGDGYTSSSHQYNDVYFILGEGSSYINWITVDENWGNTSEQQWFELIDAETGEIFGVNTYDGGVTINLTQGVPEKLNGYTYMPSSLLAQFDDTSTLASTLLAMYDLSQAETSSGVIVRYNEETKTYQMAFDYIAINIVDFTDPDTGEKTTSYETSYFEVRVEFVVDENFVITSARILVDSYQDAEYDDDYNYDEVSGTITMNDNAAPNRYAYEVGQVSGERTYYTAYPKASLIPSSFEITYNDEVIEDEIEVEFGISQKLYLDKFFPTTSGAEYISGLEFNVVNNNKEDTYVFNPYYFDGYIGFFINKAGSFTMDVIYLGNTIKTITVNAVVPKVASIETLVFEWVSGWGSTWYEANNSASSVSIEAGETFDFAVFVRPNVATQDYTYTVTEGGTLKTVTLTDCVVDWENFASYEALQFSAEAEGEYTITITSTEDPTITHDLVVSVGGSGTSGGDASGAIDVTTLAGTGTKDDPFIITKDGKYAFTAVNAYPGQFISYTAESDMYLILTTDVAEIYSKSFSTQYAKTGETAEISLTAGQTIILSVVMLEGTSDVILTVGNPEGTGEEDSEQSIEESLAGTYEGAIGEYSIMFLQNSDTGVYYMNVWNGTFDLYYTYVATDNGDGTLTIDPTFVSDYWANSGTEDVDAIADKTFIATSEGGSWTFEIEGESGDDGDEPEVTPSEPNGSAENPYVIENGTQIVVSATYYTPIYVTVNAGVTATMNDGAQFITEADGPLGTTVTPVVTTTYAVYADTMAGAMVQIVGSTGTTEEPADNVLVLGENSVYVTIVNYYCAGVEMTFTATEAGTYTISPAEGEENADLTDMGTEEWIETLPYEFTLEAGESITFLVCTSANVMTTTEDTIDLVITKADGESGEDEESTTVTGDGSEANPYVFTGVGSVMISGGGNAPIVVQIAGGLTASLDCAAQFYTELGNFESSVGTSVTPTETTTYYIFADTMAGATGMLTVTASGATEPKGNVLVLGENAVYVTIVNYYCAGVEMTFTATEAGTYTISPAEGEENADLTDMGTEEWIETLPYEFTLEAGESITFLVCTSANVMTTTEDTIDLVISKK